MRNFNQDPMKNTTEGKLRTQSSRITTQNPQSAAQRTQKGQNYQKQHFLNSRSSSLGSGLPIKYSCPGMNTLSRMRYNSSSKYRRQTRESGRTGMGSQPNLFRAGSDSRQGGGLAGKESGSGVAREDSSMVLGSRRMDGGTLGGRYVGLGSTGSLGKESGVLGGARKVKIGSILSGRKERELRDLKGGGRLKGFQMSYRGRNDAKGEPGSLGRGYGAISGNFGSRPEIGKLRKKLPNKPPKYRSPSPNSVKYSSYLNNHQENPKKLENFENTKNPQKSIYHQPELSNPTQRLPVTQNETSLLTISSKSSKPSNTSKTEIFENYSRKEIYSTFGINQRPTYESTELDDTSLTPAGSQNFGILPKKEFLKFHKKSDETKDLSSISQNFISFNDTEGSLLALGLREGLRSPSDPEKVASKASESEDNKAGKMRFMEALANGFKSSVVKETKNASSGLQTRQYMANSTISEHYYNQRYVPTHSNSVLTGGCRDVEKGSAVVGMGSGDEKTLDFSKKPGRVGVVSQAIKKGRRDFPNQEVKVKEAKVAGNHSKCSFQTLISESRETDHKRIRMRSRAERASRSMSSGALRRPEKIDLTKKPENKNFPKKPKIENSRILEGSETQKVPNMQEERPKSTDLTSKNGRKVINLSIGKRQKNGSNDKKNHSKSASWIPKPSISPANPDNLTENQKSKKPKIEKSRPPRRAQPKPGTAGLSKHVYYASNPPETAKKRSDLKKNRKIVYSDSSQKIDKLCSEKPINNRSKSSASSLCLDPSEESQFSPTRTHISEMENMTSTAFYSAAKAIGREGSHLDTLQSHEMDNLRPNFGSGQLSSTSAQNYFLGRLKDQETAQLHTGSRPRLRIHVPGSKNSKIGNSGQKAFGGIWPKEQPIKHNRAPSMAHTKQKKLFKPSKNDQKDPQSRIHQKDKKAIFEALFNEIADKNLSKLKGMPKDHRSGNPGPKKGLKTIKNSQPNFKFLDKFGTTESNRTVKNCFTGSNDTGKMAEFEEFMKSRKRLKFFKNEYKRHSRVSPSLQMYFMMSSGGEGGEEQSGGENSLKNRLKQKFEKSSSRGLSEDTRKQRRITGSRKTNSNRSRSLRQQEDNFSITTFSQTARFEGSEPTQSLKFFNKKNNILTENCSESKRETHNPLLVASVINRSRSIGFQEASNTQKCQKMNIQKIVDQLGLHKNCAILADSKTSLGSNKARFGGFESLKSAKRRNSGHTQLLTKKRSGRRSGRKRALSHVDLGSCKPFTCLGGDSEDKNFEKIEKKNSRFLKILKTSLHSEGLHDGENMPIMAEETWKGSFDVQKGLNKKIEKLNFLKEFQDKKQDSDAPRVVKNSSVHLSRYMNPIQLSEKSKMFRKKIDYFSSFNSLKRQERLTGEQRYLKKSINPLSSDKTARKMSITSNPNSAKNLNKNRLKTAKIDSEQSPLLSYGYGITPKFGEFKNKRNFVSEISSLKSNLYGLESGTGDQAEGLRTGNFPQSVAKMPQKVKNGQKSISSKKTKIRPKKAKYNTIENFTKKKSPKASKNRRKKNSSNKTNISSKKAVFSTYAHPRKIGKNSGGAPRSGAASGSRGAAGKRKRLLSPKKAMFKHINTLKAYLSDKRQEHELKETKKFERKRKGRRVPTEEAHFMTERMTSKKGIFAKKGEGFAQIRVKGGRKIPAERDGMHRGQVGGFQGGVIAGNRIQLDGDEETQKVSLQGLWSS